jgi:hypothetical protein
MTDYDGLLSKVLHLLRSVDDLERNFTKIRAAVPEQLARLLENSYALKRTIYALMAENIRNLRDKPEEVQYYQERHKSLSLILTATQVIDAQWNILSKEHIDGNDDRPESSDS